MKHTMNHTAAITEYVDVMYPDCWGDATITADEHESACARATEWLTEHEGDEVSITMRAGRTGRHSEIAGLYRVDSRSGDLRTTRYDDEDRPTARVRELVEAAYEHACETWPVGVAS
jgi:hypothetical protein